MTIAITSEPSDQRSPLRCLLHAARKGRLRWKQKAQQRNVDLKRLKVRVRDLDLSRQQHAQRADQAHCERQQAQQTIAQLQLQLDQARTENQHLAEKKTTSPQPMTPTRRAATTVYR